MFKDFEILKDKGGEDCNILSPALCRVVNADPFTLVLIIWSCLQLTWVTMLLFVQMVQIARAMTTWENMKGASHDHGSKASDALTSALTTGTLSRAGAQIGNTGLGPDPALPPTHAHDGHGHGHGHQHQGCFAQWKKILGVDTFVETALHGYEGNRNRGARRNQNPFSAGCYQNCKDFWCDPAPVFGKRPNGDAALGGEVVNYTRMYESPRLTMAARRGGGAAGAYHSVGTDDSV